ncbi:PA0069 family radical SAM protein [Pedobacter sp. SL55]|uniref:PA0069 family radical SAM protein n=1 Tax=Pedobacter sp. SL55 TaxID=2995161 RepID=UPI0022707B41|nr:PA0069 family radical SAM protein [Pedobacter sp. SL55]WAC40429.1 PA0069 family radical SAM protein [Pedobacter sp. SL55]
MDLDEKKSEYLNGRGAQLNTENRFLKNSFSKEHVEAIDDWEIANEKTSFVFSNAKSIVNKVESPDVNMVYSLNPYQGCEHGCIYCYARNSHEYWGYSAGLDFERKIIVKKDAPELFKKFIEKKGWNALPISISGNTDCYQPCERKFQLTRQILKIALTYKQPISMITKNSLIIRDLDIIKEMAKHKLISVYVSITSLNEELRQKLEPRTTTAKQRLKVIEQLSKADVPMGVMAAPMIPGLNNHEIPAILKASAEAGAIGAGYTVVRLNGAISKIFEDWLAKNFPDRFDKVWHQIQDCHNGNVNDSRFGARMRGEGNFAQLMSSTFKLHCKLNGLNVKKIELNSSAFKVPQAQLNLF